MLTHLPSPLILLEHRILVKVKTVIAGAKNSPSFWIA